MDEKAAYSERGSLQREDLRERGKEKEGERERRGRTDVNRLFASFQNLSPWLKDRSELIRPYVLIRENVFLRVTRYSRFSACLNEEISSETAAPKCQHSRYATHRTVRH